MSALVLTFVLAAGCGGDAGDAQTPASGGQAPPASGIEPASPAAAAGCLERAGFDVTDGQSAGGVAELVTFLGDGGVEGAINYFEREDDAFNAEVAALAAQEPEARVGRIGTALYSFEGEGPGALERVVRACLSP